MGKGWEIYWRYRQERPAEDVQGHGSAAGTGGDGMLWLYVLET